MRLEKIISDTVQIVVQRRNEKNIGKNLGNRNAQFFYSPTIICIVRKEEFLYIYTFLLVPHICVFGGILIESFLQFSVRIIEKL